MEASYKSDIKSLSRPREHKNHFKSDDQSTIKENRETEAIRNLLSAPNSLRGFNSIKSDTSIMSKTFHSLDHERPFNLYHPKFFEKRLMRRIKIAPIPPKSHQKPIRCRIKIESPNITNEEKENIKKKREYIKLLNIAMMNQKQKLVELQSDRSNTNRSNLLL